MAEKEKFGELSATRTSSSRGAPHLTSTQRFVERERKRLAAAEEAVLAAVRSRDESFSKDWHTKKKAPAGEEPLAGPIAHAEAELVRLGVHVFELQGSTSC